MITFIIGTSRDRASDIFNAWFADFNPTVTSTRTSFYFENEMTSIIGNFDITVPKNNKYNPLFCFGSKSFDNEADAIEFKLKFSEYIIDEVIS